MKTGTLDTLKQRLENAPPNALRDDLWAHRCCEQAYLALAAGNYGVGAILVNADDELVCEARNQVFVRDMDVKPEPDKGYQSQRHAEMQILDRLETEFTHLDRRSLTLYVSLEPCLMCSGRILLSGIGRVRYLAADKAGGFASRLHSAFHSPLPPAWQNLASGVNIRPADVQGFWPKFVQNCVEADADAMRRKVVAAWTGGPEKHQVKEKGDT